MGLAVYICCDVRIIVDGLLLLDDMQGYYVVFVCVVVVSVVICVVVVLNVTIAAYFSALQLRR